MSGALSVSGGAGGVLADVADLRRTAALLDRAAAELMCVVDRVRWAARDPALVLTVPLAPVTAGRVEGLLLRAVVGPHGLLLVVLRVRALAVLLAARASLVEMADTGVVLARGLGQGLLGGAVLEALPVAVAGELAVRLTPEVAGALHDAVQGELTWAALGGRLAAVGHGSLQDGTRLLLAHPELTDAAVGAVPPVPGLPGLPLPRGQLLPSGAEGLLATLTVLAGAGGLLQSRPVDVRPVDVRSVDGPKVRPVSGVGDLVASQAELVGLTAADPDSSRVRVRRVAGDDGRTRWLVEVPGTQEWGPRSGGDPSDLTSNVSLMTGRASELADGVVQAMSAAGIAPGEAVLLAGHSQGGILAARLACDPAVRRRFAITHVVTAGSPVARVPVPGSVSVLSLEQDADPVPRLDGRRNPGRPGWTTVRHSVPAQELPTPSLAAAHSVQGYRATGSLVDSSRAPSVLAWRAGAAGFFRGHTSSQDFELQRRPR